MKKFKTKAMQEYACENQDETILQNKCMAYLDKMGYKYFHRYNYTTQKYRKSVHEKFKGWPDLTIPMRSKTIYIELKMPGCKLLPEQVQYKEYFLDNGHEWFLIDNIEDFKNIIQKHI